MTRSFVIDNTLVGIRTNSEACAEWLDETLGEYEYTAEAAAPYYSMYIGKGRGRSTPKWFHVLYREAATVVKTFDLAELGRTLIAELETHTLRRRDDAIYLTCSPVSRNGATVLMPADLVTYMATAGRRMVERHELDLPDSFALALEPSGTLSTVRPTLRTPPDAIERLTTIGSTAEASRATAAVPTTPDIVLIGNFWLNGGEPIRPISRGLALYHLALQTENLHVLGGAALQALARLLAGVPCYEIREGPAGEVLATLSQVLGEGLAA